jgi:hypothetical protein
MQAAYKPAPLALFVYARPDHTRRTVEALQRNELAGETDLVVFSDSARSPDKEAAVAEVRAYVTRLKGFRSVRVVPRPYNFGLSKSIIDGVSAVLAEHEHLIVLEDDMVTSRYFLTYMNEALSMFAENDSVISIHGYVYPVARPLPEAFFLPGADCWGWATWRRGWRLFNPDGMALLRELKLRGLVKTFDYDGAYAYSRMLEQQVAGTNDSWAIRWYASALLAGKRTLYPGRSLVHNIGNDSSGTHCHDTDVHDAVVSESRIDLARVEDRTSSEARQIFVDYFRQVRGNPASRLFRRVRQKLGGLVR